MRCARAHIQTDTNLISLITCHDELCIESLAKELPPPPPSLPPSPPKPNVVVVSVGVVVVGVAVGPPVCELGAHTLNGSGPSAPEEDA